MTQSTTTKSISSKTYLSFNMQNIDNLFSGFALDDFALMYGIPFVLHLSLLLSVRAQLPYQLEGLESTVVFVDGGNTFRLYTVSRMARLHHLQPRQVLERIFISRAFTAYQMTSIILEKLEETVAKYHAKFVILSDLVGLYLDKDISTDESKEVFSQVTTYLSEFAKKNHVIILATYPSHDHSRRNTFFRVVASARSNVIIAVTEKSTYPFTKQFALEKHPVSKLGYVDFPTENPTLEHFAEGIEYGKDN